MIPPIRITGLTQLFLFTVVLLLLAGPSNTVTASVFGPERRDTTLLTNNNGKANGGKPIARNLQPTKRQSAAGSGTSQRLGRRSKKVIQTAAEAAAAKAKRDYGAFLCGAGTVSCPVLTDGVRGLDGRELKHLGPKEMDAQLNSLADWFRIGFECIDTAVEVNNCGGCSALGGGANCTSIPSITRVSCEQGQCRVHQCVDGYTVNADKKGCVSRPGPAGGNGGGPGGSGSSGGGLGSGGFFLDEDEDEMVLSPRR